MAEALKPCPFCGEGTHIRTLETAHGSVLYGVSCPTEGCFGFSMETYFDTPEEAIAAWNRRAERTCRDETGSPQSFLCSECGWFDTDLDDLPLNYNYCPNCGARVVKS